MTSQIVALMQPVRVKLRRCDLLNLEEILPIIST